jgi:hypothetical protein
MSPGFWRVAENRIILPHLARFDQGKREAMAKLLLPSPNCSLSPANARQKEFTLFVLMEVCLPSGQIIMIFWDDC